jgi:hypothetical protein
MKKLIEDQFPKYGIFTEEVEKINYKDYLLLSPLGSKKNSIQKYFAYNQFQYLGGVSEDLIFGVAIADLKLLSNAFYYIYLPKEKKILSKSIKSPFALGTKFTDQPEIGEVKFDFLGTKVKMIQHSYKKELEITSKDLNMSVNFMEKDIDVLRICTKAGANGWVYVRKNAGSKLEGRIESKLGNFELNKLNIFGHNDFSMGYMRKETFWNWTCFTGLINKKDIIGVNLSAGVNETEFSENSIWLNGKLFSLPQVSFVYDKLNLMQKWIVQSKDDSINLEFTPEGIFKENVNAILLASNFNQLYGKYKGKIKLENKTYTINNLYGYAEDHYAKW